LAVLRSRVLANPLTDLERRRIVFAAYSGELVLPQLRQGIVTGQDSRPEEAMRFATLRSNTKADIPQQRQCPLCAKSGHQFLA
jgi:hypothetical protein